MPSNETDSYCCLWSMVPFAFNWVSVSCLESIFFIKRGLMCSVRRRTPDAGGPPSNTKGAVVQITNRKRLMYQYAYYWSYRTAFFVYNIPLEIIF